MGFADALIEKYYADNAQLRGLLIHHSEQVARRALSIARRHPEFLIDEDFLWDAACLHDVGIFLTDAPGIGCHGTAPYLAHGVLGARLMREEGFEDIARVCERHTGTGLSAAQIVARGLPIPAADYYPETEAEQVICYADKFYSKSHPERERTIEQTAESLRKFGEDGVVKFLAWAAKYEDWSPHP